MVAASVLLVVGLLAVIAVANAARPARGRVTVVLSWPAAWITAELAVHLVASGALAAIALIALGALAHPVGVAGLALLGGADAVAIPKILRARRTVVDFGTDVAELDPDPGRIPYPRSHVALPFLAWHRRDVRVTRGVEYAQIGRLRLRLDVYRAAAESSGPRPAVVQVHGGAWIIGSRHEQGVPLLGHLAANGWVGFNIDYRLSPRATFPEHVIDVKRAIAWVREHAAEYGADPAFIALTGGSAGGHLSALAALTADDTSLQPGFEDADTSVDACIPFYGVYDLVDADAIHLPLAHDILERVVLKARRARDQQPFRAASPAHRVHAGAPPFLVIHGEDDSLVPAEDARRFVARLREVSRAPVVYAEMQGAQHAFDVFPSWRTIAVIEAIERFLASVRSGAGAKVSAP